MSDFFARLSGITAPAASTQGEADTDVEPPLYAGEESPAVAEIEADLRTSFAAMSSIDNAPASALQQLRTGIASVVKQQAILKHGFMGEHHFEQEGSDAILFDDVPSWITFSRISGCRYRMVRRMRT